MRKALILLTITVMTCISIAAAADDLTDLLCLKNGIKPDNQIYEEMYYSDPLPEGCPDSWKIKDGVLYDTATKTALIISEDAGSNGTLTFEPGTRFICADALQMNETIREMILPDGLEVIGECALTGFIGIDSDPELQTIHVPSSVRLIQEPLGTCVYSMGCSKPYFIVDESNPRYVSMPDGLLIDKLENAVLWCASFREPRTITVPDGIRRIAPFAFAGCHEIVSVSLPESLIEIGEGAFDMMSGLTEITIPKNVLRIGSGNFAWVGRDEYEQWYLDRNGQLIMCPVNSTDGIQKLSDDEVLRKFGIDRQPGITFKGTAFLLEVHKPLEDYPYDTTFEPCCLPVRCPAGAFCLDYLETVAQRLTVIESDE